MRRLWQFCRDQRGATAIEYALLAAISAIALMSALTFFSDSTKAMYGHIATTVDQPVAPGTGGQGS